MITPESLITRNDHLFLASELGNEIVMMNMENGDYLGLNEVSADIWKLLEEPLNAETIVAKLVNMYTISETDCKEQTLPFLQEMADNNLIAVR